MRTLFAVLVLATAVPVFGREPADEAHLPDARLVLQRAAEAIRASRGFACRATYSAIGDAANWPTYEGRLRIERLGSESPVPARLSLEATGWLTGESAPSRYTAAFDGSVVRWLDHAGKRLIERPFLPDGPSAADWGKVTQHFGRAGASLVPWEFTQAEPLARALAAETIEYQGAVAVEGVLCDIVYVETERLGRRRMENWFISTEDRLPRRHERFWIEDGRVGAELLVLSDLERHPGTASFSLSVPSDYEVGAHVERDAPKAGLAVGHPAPEWTLRDADGETRSLAELRGRIVVLDFWATWCVPCKRVMPVLQDLHEAWGERGVVVVGINAFQHAGIKDPAAYLERMEYTYLNLFGGDETATAYGASGLPSTFVVDRGGRIVFVHRGSDPDLRDRLDEVIRGCLEQDAGG